MQSNKLLLSVALPVLSKSVRTSALRLLTSDILARCRRTESLIGKSDLNKAQECGAGRLARARRNVDLYGNLFLDTQHLYPALAGYICMWNAVYRVCRSWSMIDASETRKLAAHQVVYEHLRNALGLFHQKHILLIHRIQKQRQKRNRHC